MVVSLIAFVCAAITCGLAHVYATEAGQKIAALGIDWNRGWSHRCCRESMWKAGYSGALSIILAFLAGVLT